MPPQQDTTALKEKIKFRTMKASDLNFILSSWLKTYKYSGPTVRRMFDRVYYEVYEPKVKELIKRSDVYIASLREDEDVIVGYLAIERLTDRDIIHFCAVKDSWQKMGIARQLIDAARPQPSTYYTHWTSPMVSLSHKIPYIFQPFLIHKE